MFHVNMTSVPSSFGSIQVLLRITGRTNSAESRQTAVCSEYKNNTASAKVMLKQFMSL